MLGLLHEGKYQSGHESEPPLSAFSGSLMQWKGWHRSDKCPRLEHQGQLHDRADEDGPNRLGLFSSPLESHAVGW